MRVVPLLCGGGTTATGVVDAEVWPRLGRERIRRQGVGVAHSLRQTRCHERGPGESLFSYGDSSSCCWVSDDHLPSSIHLFSLGIMIGANRGGERWRLHSSAPLSGRRRDASSPRGNRWPGGPGPVPGDAAGGSGEGGLLDHSWAMIASNSARSSSWSAQTRSRKSWFTPCTTPVSTFGTVGMRLTARGQAVMACWPSFRLLISILRGLACSATGTFNVSTPAS